MSYFNEGHHSNAWKRVTNKPMNAATAVHIVHLADSFAARAASRDVSAEIFAAVSASSVSLRWTSSRICCSRRCSSPIHFATARRVSRSCGAFIHSMAYGMPCAFKFLKVSAIACSSIFSLSKRNHSMPLTETNHRPRSVSKYSVEKMDQYKEFCRLRDYRKPGAEVCRHTEAEAFSMAISEGAARELAVLVARHERVLDGLILMAEEFAAARWPGKCRHAFRNFAVIVRGLKANPNENKTATWSTK